MASYKTIDINDCIEYYNSNNQLHNENGPAIITPGNAKSWYINGVIHRLEGPAYIETKGIYEWYKNGKLHREDGPAIRFYNLEKSYYLEGIQYQEKDYYEIIKNIKKKRVNHLQNKLYDIFNYLDKDIINTICLYTV
jgi:hypothetical protein